MQSSYRLNARDLDHHFLESLKALFQDREIEIVVYEVDEAAYLSRSEANQRRLLAAIENVENGTNLITVNLEELE
jgi:antitoxin YefM